MNSCGDYLGSMKVFVHGKHFAFGEKWLAGSRMGVFSDESEKFNPVRGMGVNTDFRRNLHAVETYAVDMLPGN